MVLVFFIFSNNPNVKMVVENIAYIIAGMLIAFVVYTGIGFLLSTPTFTENRCSARRPAISYNVRGKSKNEFRHSPPKTADFVPFYQVEKFFNGWDFGIRRIGMPAQISAHPKDFPDIFCPYVCGLSDT